MGLSDDFSDCITLKGLPPELADKLPDGKAALTFAVLLINGTTMIAALVAIGAAAPRAAAAAEAVSVFTVGVIIGAVLGCAGVALGSSLPFLLAEMDPPGPERAGPAARGPGLPHERGGINGLDGLLYRAATNTVVRLQDSDGQYTA